MTNWFLLALAILIYLNPENVQAQKSPYPPSPVVREIQFLWPTHIRLATGSDNWPVTWADDDHQYTVWGDGGGFGGTNSIGRSSLGVARIQNGWHDLQATNIWGGYRTTSSHQTTGKSYGILCVEGVLYMWVGMLETKENPFGEVKIAYSDDHGLNWQFSDWSFRREEGIMMPAFCNFGRDYSGARDTFVYSYLIRFQSEEGPDNYEDKVDWLNCQKPGMIDLARVPKNQILNRDQYSFYAGLGNGEVLWTMDPRSRKPVFENSEGVGWCMNVTFNAGLNRYLLTTEHTETHRGNLAIFDSPEPWGPWTTIYYGKKWGEGHVPLNTFFWNFSNKWTSEDGKSFSLIFTGRKENDSFNTIRGTFVLRDE